MTRTFCTQRDLDILPSPPPETRAPPPPPEARAPPPPLETRAPPPDEARGAEEAETRGVDILAAVDPPEASGALVACDTLGAEARGVLGAEARGVESDVGTGTLACDRAAPGACLAGAAGVGGALRDGVENDSFRRIGPGGELIELAGAAGCAATRVGAAADPEEGVEG